ncbi:hypothetical protein [Chitinimonas naiadis]
MLRRGIALFAILLTLLGMSGTALADNNEPHSAAQLRARYAALRTQLVDNVFHRPVYMESHEADRQVDGEVYALVRHPFGTLQGALTKPAYWCEVLLLHLNTKYCRASTEQQPNRLQLGVGKKYDQPLEDAYRLDFAWHVESSTPEYLQLHLNADSGPFSTRDYQILFEAIPLDDYQSFIHLSYSYGYGLVGKFAMTTYLNTIGRGKVGFSTTGKQEDGQPVLVNGARGLVERNTMRYFLAIETSLAALAAPPAQRMEQNLRAWFKAVEQFPRQLHEMEQEEYLAMKRKEYARAKSEATPP